MQMLRSFSCGFLGKGTVLLAALFGLLLCAPAAHAAPLPSALSAVIVGPMPNSVLLTNTAVLFELEITGGNPLQPMLVQWDLNNDGTYDTPILTVPVSAWTGLSAFPGRFIDGSGFANLRYRNAPGGGYVFTSPGTYLYKVKVTNGSSTFVSPAQTAFIVDDLAFSGYAWAGASTVDGAPDAFGWTSFSCANENEVCATVPKYSVMGSTPIAGTPPFGGFNGFGWIGAEDPVGAGTLQWLSFSKKFCQTNAPAQPTADDGKECDVDADCGAGRTCVSVGAPPATFAEEDLSASKRMSRLYSSAETFGTILRYPSQLVGWARYINYGALGTDWGWLHLRGPGLVKPYTDQATKGFSQCSACSSGDEKCNICGAVSNGGVVKNAACNSCYTCDADGNCDSCEVCDQYGISYDATTQLLKGYAWAGGQTVDGSDEGFGWLQFDPERGGIGLLQAWLATRYGDVFVGGSVSVSTPLPAPIGQYNATYVIQANGAVAFVSRAGYEQPFYPSVIPVPSAETQYINVLGRLDFNEMLKCDFATSITCDTRYGATVLVSEGEINTWSSKLLDGKVYYAPGDVTISNPISFLPGAGDDASPGGGGSGAGTVIIDGDLTLTKPVTYQTTAVGKIFNVPSVTWLVRGDIFIDPSLGTEPASPDDDPNLVGAFFAVGCPGTGTACGDAATGIVHTGATGSLELIVNGLMMAKQFDFQRTTVSSRGSEQIIYDGRLLANPPPGLQDLTAVLPTIRAVTP